MCVNAPANNPPTIMAKKIYVINFQLLSIFLFQVS
jgi:hypothetical protein